MEVDTLVTDFGRLEGWKIAVSWRVIYFADHMTSVAGKDGRGARGRGTGLGRSVGGTRLSRSVGGVGLRSSTGEIGLGSACLGRKRLEQSDQIGN